MSIFLKLFSTEVLIQAVLGIIISHIKNPSSDKARRIRSIVGKLNDATQVFLERVPEA